MIINRLSYKSAVPSTTIKNILYGNSKKTGIVTLKMIFDGLDVTAKEFFDTDVFENLEQQIK